MRATWCPTLNKAEKKFKRNPFNKNLQQILICARKQFKKACKKSERKFRNKLTNNLLSIEKDNPSEFWNLIKKMRK